MSFPDKIFLIGMPGSGKSTLGKILADRLNMEFVDLDQKIEEKTQCSIKEIFAKHGESYFRELERDTLDELAVSATNYIIATGGGAPCYFDNMRVIENNGISIFIDTPLSEIVVRLNAYEKGKRPKFAQGKGLLEQLEKLYSDRVPFYQRADLKWTGSLEAVDQLTSKLKKLKKLN